MHFTHCTKKNLIHADACLQQRLCFSASVSDAIILAHFLATRPNKPPNDRAVCIKKQAEYICELKQYAPLVSFFALSSVLKNQICSHYPEAGHLAIRHYYNNGIIKPKLGVQHQRIIHLLWSKENLDNTRSCI